MKLSKRLNRLAEMVTEGNRLADVGTDHGYVPICLCQEKRIPGAIAMDINEGPLFRAQSHIRECGLEDYIETRLSDGLAALQPKEADTILIAGMGGALMVRILSEGQSRLEGVQELILQPQSEIGDVRRWLLAHGYCIVCEDILLDEGKYYPMMKAVPGEGEIYSEEEYRFGRLELQRSPDMLQEFLEKSLAVQRQIAATLPVSGTDRIQKRRLEVEEEIRTLQRILKHEAET